MNNHQFDQINDLIAEKKSIENRIIDIRVEILETIRKIDEHSSIENNNLFNVAVKLAGAGLLLQPGLLISSITDMSGVYFSSQQKESLGEYLAQKNIQKTLLEEQLNKIEMEISNIYTQSINYPVQRISTDVIRENQNVAWLNKMAVDKEKHYLYREALVLFEQSLNCDANQFDIWYQKAKILYYLNDIEKSLASINISLSINNDNSQAYFLQALCFNQLNKIFEAEDSLIKCLRINNNHQNAWEELAKFSYNKGDYIKAEKYAQKSVSLGNKTPNIFLLLGKISYFLEKPTDAVNYLNQCNSINNTISESWLYLGFCYCFCNDYVKAKISFNNVIILEPNNYLATLNIGKIYFIEEQYLQSVELLEPLVLSQDDTFNKLELYFYLAKNYLFLNAYSDSITWFYNALEISCFGKFQEEILYWCGYLSYYFEKNPQKAINFINTCVEKYGISEQNTLLLGEIYFSKNDNELALQYFNECLRINNLNKNAWLNIALIYELKQEKAKAVTAFDNVIIIDPSNCFAMVKKSKLLIDQEEYIDALSLLENLISINPKQDLENFYWIGFCHFNLDNLRAALIYFEQFLSFSNTNNILRENALHYIRVANFDLSKKEDFQILNKDFNVVKDQAYTVSFCEFICEFNKAFIRIPFIDDEISLDNDWFYLSQILYDGYSEDDITDYNEYLSYSDNISYLSYVRDHE